MEQILVYSDSLSWGIIPDTRRRLAFDQRWPGVMEIELLQQQKVRVIENCLNGRRTAWSDPYKEGRDGSVGLAQVIEMHSPLACVVLMLGTNDFQAMHNNNAWLSAQGVAKLIQTIRQAPIEPGMIVPSIIVVAPPVITKPKGAIAHKFHDAEKRCIGLTNELQLVAQTHDCLFFDANTVVSASAVDGIHLDEQQHNVLGRALAHFILNHQAN